MSPILVELCDQLRDTVIVVEPTSKELALVQSPVEATPVSAIIVVEEGTSTEVGPTSVKDPPPK